ncbi:unnamed protein product [marine sediment metagenome]|uniref:Uncharacterized protein n=1 Tax=marine sediment metagenome TaxID=412755 RepID=X1FZT3_9ZZZZ
MGEEAMRDKLAFVSFEPSNEHFTAFLPMEELISSDNDPELMLRKAAEVYEHSIVKMRNLVKEIQDFRDNRKLLPARKVWQLGDAIFELQHDLNNLSLQLDGLYDHLARDLGVKRKWLEKVIIFRRYLPDENAVPQSLNWGRCEKGTRRVAENLKRDYH